MLLVAVLFACNPGSTSTDASTFSITDANNALLAEVSISEQEITVSGKEVVLTGIVKKDKRKYYTSSNAMEYAVKFSDDGFKLRDRNEQLLWKIKWYEDKIKIANNEEMGGAYEIKLREEGKVKLEKNDALVTELRLTETEAVARVSDTYSVEGCGVSLAPAILLMPELKEYEKFIIMAEIRAKGR